MMGLIDGSNDQQAGVGAFKDAAGPFFSRRVSDFGGVSIARGKFACQATAGTILLDRYRSAWEPIECPFAES